MIAPAGLKLSVKQTFAPPGVSRFALVRVVPGAMAAGKDTPKTETVSEPLETAVAGV